MCITKFDCWEVIIIHPYVYRLYWYLEAYNVTLAIAFCNTLVVE